MRPLRLCILGLLLAAPVYAGDGAPRIVGHRGLIHHAPENTLAGFTACLELRIGFEVDVRRSKDGKLVCMHDATVNRTTDGKGAVAELSFAELGKLDAGRRFHADFANERIPTLFEALAPLAPLPLSRGDRRVPTENALIALDIKDPDIETDLVGIIGTVRASRQVVCIGLAIDRPEVRKKLRAAGPKIGIAVLAQTAKDLTAALEDASADWIYVRFVPTREQAALIHKQGKRIFIAGPAVASVEEANWRGCRDAGVDAILTDYPLECRAALEAKDPDPKRWEKTIAQFEEQDAKRPFPPGGVVFTGSSSIALWKDLASHFPGHDVLNRGFGGSSLPEVNHYLDRTVLKHKPRTVVLFCGGNDLASHKRSPEQVAADFQTFVDRIHAAAPETKILYLSIHLPPSRVSQAERTKRANALIAAACKRNPKLAFVDIHTVMLGKDGRPNADLYVDPLHPNQKAYQLWAEKIRPLLK